MLCARSLSTSATLALLLFSACNPPAGTGPSPGRLAPPATFVLAWTGPGGAILTVESGDGAVWRRRTAHDTTRSRDFGPVLAHDGRLNWMLMWADGPELQYKIGIGGASAAGGIVWESVPTTGVLPVRPGSSPALAYANDRWLAVWVGAGGTLRAVRSARNSATAWDTAVAVRHGPMQAASPAVRAPALTSATIGGQRVFVLVYDHQTLGAVAATSSDGLSWSAPAAIGATQKDAAVAEWNGNLYVALARQVGIGYRNFIYKSTNAVNWREIASHPQAPVNAAGPGLAVAPWKLLLTEQIGGAAGGGAQFTGISHRAGTPGSPSSDPSGFAFTGDRPVVTAGGSAPESVGRLLARTALLYAEPSGQPVTLTDLAVTQSGIVDTLPPAELIAGKTTLVRASLRARAPAAGQTGRIDSARMDVIDASSGATLASVPGFSYGADNVTLMPAIPDSADAHFFITGAMIAGDTDVRLDLTLVAGSTRRVITGAVDVLRYRRNKGMPLIVTGFDVNPPSAATVAGELMQLGRIFPLADAVGSLASATAGSPGVRFNYVSPIALPVQGSLGSYADEFVLLNVPVGATGPSGIACAADAIPTPFPGRVFAINFTGPEDLDRNGTFSASELFNCTGSPSPVTIRFGNFIGRLGSETLARWAAVTGPDQPEFGVAVMTFGGTGAATAQNRSGLAGQCPQGLGGTRLCWASVGLNAPVLQHELGHAIGLCHVDDPNCATAAPPFPPGRFGYDLLNRIRVATPQRMMTGSVPGGLGTAFLTPVEYEQARTALLSQQYLAARVRTGPGIRVAAAGPAAFLQAGRVMAPRAMIVAGSTMPSGSVHIVSIRATSVPMPTSAGGDDLVARQLDRAGGVIARTGFALPGPAADRGWPGERVPFAIAVPLDERARTIAFDHRGREIHRVDASANAPVVRLDPGALAAAGDSIVVRWSARDADGDTLTYDVGLVYDGGRRTELLAAGVRGSRLTVPAARARRAEAALSWWSRPAMASTSRRPRRAASPWPTVRRKWWSPTRRTEPRSPPVGVSCCAGSRWIRRTA